MNKKIKILSLKIKVYFNTSYLENPENSAIDQAWLVLMFIFLFLEAKFLSIFYDTVRTPIDFLGHLYWYASNIPMLCLIICSLRDFISRFVRPDINNVENIIKIDREHIEKLQPDKEKKLIYKELANVLNSKEKRTFKIKLL